MPRNNVKRQQTGLSQCNYCDSIIQSKSNTGLSLKEFCDEECRDKHKQEQYLDADDAKRIGESAKETVKQFNQSREANN